jgi:hypothetical protein
MRPILCENGTNRNTGFRILILASIARLEK